MRRISPQSAEPKALNIGWTGGSAWTALPDRVAMERGFFEKEGLKPRYIQFQGTNLMLNALMSHELDYVTILPFIAGAATRGLPVKIVATTARSSGYAIISRPDIDSVKALKGKRIAINTFGSSADFAIYQMLSAQRPRSEQRRDAALGHWQSRRPFRRAASAVRSMRLWSIARSSTAPSKRVLRRFSSVKEMAEFVRIPINGLSTSQRKIDREPDEIVRMLRALRNAILFLQNQREIGRRLGGKTFKARPSGRRALLRALSRTVQSRSHGP